MLTRHDRTIETAPAVLDEIRPLGLGHIGFKDVGADRDRLAMLNRAIRDAGAVSYLEIVSAGPAAAVAAARLAREIGVDRLLGGTATPAMLAALAGSAVAYYPFVGTPLGHPTRLGGDAADIAADCRAARARGCAGVDLLAYRAIEADPLALVRAARAATDGWLIVAGSVDSPSRVSAVAEAGADAFTIGTAAIEGRFARGRQGLAAQLMAIRDAAVDAAPIAEASER